MDDDMKINSSTVKRLRAERAWSQEQLAEIADVSLRTIQRVEAEGGASRETRMAIAAAFGINVGELNLPDAPPLQAPPQTPALGPATLARHRHAGQASLAMAVMVGITQYFQLDVIPLAIVNLLLMGAITGALYAGFGWYFSGRTAPTTPARRTVQFGFVFGAVALAFASLSPAPKTAALSALQLMLLACAIHAAFGIHRARQAKSQGPGPA
ncbi:helix-turn-helix transcriptional regulator [Duganella aceris]|uniref:helix-turn-helix transcriptional regulator n=1 Tax=Duganella aceris TaxID=2703883 RepID=UPI001A9561E5|nr:helix-turn-helix transcriptional regulator [Duganella aceris]